MADDLLYQCTVRGRGFHGPGQQFPAQAIDIARDHMKTEHGPWHFSGQPKQEHKRSEILDLALKKLRNRKPGQLPIVMLPHNYDEPGISLRVIKAAPDEAPWVMLARDFETPCAKYLLGSIPSKPCPTLSDCSGLASHCVEATTGIALPHSALAMAADNRIFRFQDMDATQSGDFIFYSFGRLGGAIDDVAMVVGETQPGMQIGARPSIKPGYHSDGVQIWSMNAPGEPENRVGFGRLKR